jgi:hypothetical protein
VKSGYERPADIYKICRYARTAETITQSIIDWPDAHDTPVPRRPINLNNKIAAGPLNRDAVEYATQKLNRVVKTQPLL